MSEGIETTITDKKPPKIIGQFISSSEPIAADLPAGDYLYIETGQKTLYLPKEKVLNLHSKARSNTRVNISSTEPQIGSIDSIQFEEAVQMPDFQELMEYLVNEIQISLDSEKELVIASADGLFLELPWESIYNDKTYVFREVVSNNKKDFEEKENNLMIFVSHSVKHDGESLAPIKEKLDQEVNGIISLIKSTKENDTPSHFKLRSILLSMHTSDAHLKSTPLAIYNYGHFIMHGLKNGELCLEHPNDHEQVVTISVPDLLDALKDQSFKLLFFSFCYSGGGLDDAENLSVKIIKNGLSQYVIGYSHPVGEESASSFTQIFYSNLFQKEDKIEAVYKKSLQKYYQDNPSNRYTPLLYIYS